MKFFKNRSATSILGLLLMIGTVLMNALKAIIPETEGPIDAILINLSDLKNIVIGFFVNIARMRTLAPGWAGFFGLRVTK